MILAMIKRLGLMGKLLQELNHTLIVLVPKVPTPSFITDYRPISCCRKISDNILLTQELMHNYHRSFGPPRCAFKVDIQKAYDTVEWSFLKNVLVGFGFAEWMVDWIMLCVSSTSYSVCVNGNTHGYFKEERGLRKGVTLLQLDAFMDSLSKFSKMSDIWVCPLLRRDSFIRIVVFLLKDWRNALQTGKISFSHLLHGKAKVSWKAVCVPKYEGGLGIRRIGDVNKSLIASHVWSILTRRESLWVDWIYSYRLNNRSFWECKSPANCCWSWRKILQIRPLLRTFIWSKIGDGKSTSACVADILNNGTWLWPAAWRDLFPVLNQINVHVQPGVNDRIVWKVGNDFRAHSSAMVWDCIRTSEPEVSWVNIVWFSQCIPRHAFLMWLM
uniref:Putative reverse transcriptase domain-containing protein n=1 Tax=Helianthus annuus TaxID=4232 RepID=A0A251RYM8_HELAN